VENLAMFAKIYQIDILEILAKEGILLGWPTCPKEEKKLKFT
jgi:hypothetical protein